MNLVEESVQWILNIAKQEWLLGNLYLHRGRNCLCHSGLWVWNEKVAKIPKTAFRNGARWLKEHLDQPYPPLWIGKCLYNPSLVIRSAVISALALAQITS